MFFEVLMSSRSKNSLSLIIFSETALSNSNCVSRKEAMFVCFTQKMLMPPRTFS